MAEYWEENGRLSAFIWFNVLSYTTNKIAKVLKRANLQNILIRIYVLAEK